MAAPTYRDIDFSLGKLEREGGDWINTKNNETDIIQSIKNIVLSSNGEVPFVTNRIGLWEKKFDVLTVIGRQLLASDIYRLINFYEPRVKVKPITEGGVIVTQTDSLLQVEINFSILTTPKVDRNVLLTLNRAE